MVVSTKTNFASYEKTSGSPRQLQEFDIKETWNRESRFKRGYPKALIKNLLKKFSSKIASSFVGQKQINEMSYNGLS